MPKLGRFFIREAIIESIKFLFIPGGAGVGLGIWGILYGLSPSIIAFIVLGAIAFTSAIVYFLFEILERFRKTLDQLPISDLEATIKNWLLRNRWSIEEEDQPGLYFQLIARKHSHLVLLSYGERDITTIQVWARLIFRQDHRPTYDAMNPTERGDMIQKIREALLSMGVQFDGVKHPLEEIVLVDYMPIDSAFTENVLMRHMLNIIRAQSIIKEILSGTARHMKSSASQEFSLQPIPDIQHGIISLRR